MPVRIRLRRVGRKKQASFRIVVADSEAPQEGAYVENLGYYNPRRQPAELRLDLPRVDYWLEHGAEPTPTAASLIHKARKGGDEDAALVLVGAAEGAAAVAGEDAAPESAAGEAPAAEAAAAAEPAAKAPARRRKTSKTEEPSAADAAEPEAPAEE